MGQRLLNLRVRPPRLVVLIDEDGSSKDFMTAVRFLSQVWGGRYCPIIPVNKHESDTLTEFRLRQWRPDYVFGISIDDSAWKPIVHRTCQPRHYSRLDENSAKDLRQYMTLRLIHADRAIISMFDSRSKPSTIQRPVKAVSTASTCKWAPFVAALCGIHHPELGEKYRDEQEVLQLESTADFIAAHKDFVEHWKMSWLEAGSFGLSTDIGMSFPVEPTIVLVRNLIMDLCHFWNLRIACDTRVPPWVLPLPCDDICDRQIAQSVSEWIGLYRQYGWTSNYCVLTSASMPREDVRSAASPLQDLMEGAAIKHVDYAPPQKRLPQVHAFEYTTIWPVTLTGRRITILPPPVKIVPQNHDAWFVDILNDSRTGRPVKRMQCPDSTVMPELLNSPSPPGMSFSGIPSIADGQDSLNIRCTSDREVVHCFLPSSVEVFEEILRESGYDIVHDEKRSSYGPILRRFGGLQMAASALSGDSGKIIDVLAGRSVRPRDSRAEAQYQARLASQGLTIPVDEIKSEVKLGKGVLKDKHLIEEVDKHLSHCSERTKRIGKKRFMSYFRRQIPDEMTIEAFLEHWAERRIVKREWHVGPCSRCHRKCFLGKIRLTSPVRCLYCGHRISMKASTKIGYSLVRSVRHSLSEGLEPVVLAGRFLRNLSNRGFFWLPGLKYKKGELRGDIDIVACCDGHVVFVECKRLAQVTADTSTWPGVTKKFFELADVAVACHASLVVLAAQVVDFPETVKEEIHAKLSGRIPFLLLNNQDLESGHRSMNNEKEWLWMSIQNVLPKESPESPNEGRSGTREMMIGGGHFTKSIQERPAV